MSENLTKATVLRVLFKATVKYIICYRPRKVKLLLYMQLSHLELPIQILTLQLVQGLRPPCRPQEETPNNTTSERTFFLKLKTVILKLNFTLMLIKTQMNLHHHSWSIIVVKMQFNAFCHSITVSCRNIATYLRLNMASE